MKFILKRFIYKVNVGSLGENESALERYELKLLWPFVWMDNEQRIASVAFVMISHKDCEMPNVEIEVLCSEEPDLAHFRLS